MSKKKINNVKVIEDNLMRKFGLDPKNPLILIDTENYSRDKYMEDILGKSNAAIVKSLEGEDANESN